MMADAHAAPKAGAQFRRFPEKASRNPFAATSRAIACQTFVSTVAAMVAAAGMLFASAPSNAAPHDRLQGAWGANTVACDKIFTRRGGRFVFNRARGENWPGFIVTGNSVNGSNASCRLVSSKDKGDTVTYLLSCREEIAFDSMTVSIRFINDRTLERFDPDFPELRTTYARCD